MNIIRKGVAAALKKLVSDQQSLRNKKVSGSR